MDELELPTGDLLEVVLKVLRSLRDTRQPEFGICLNFYEAMEEGGSYYFDTNHLIQSVAATWPKFSGTLCYPVPHNTLSPIVAYDESTNVWDKRTQYGRDRHELLEFIITTLEESKCT